jgi:hypothetical protein
MFRSRSANDAQSSEGRGYWVFEAIPSDRLSEDWLFLTATGHGPRRSVSLAYK